MEKEMRELYTEGVAIHGGPESCGGAREGVGEALIGVRVGWAMEPRNQRFGVPTPYNQAEGNIDGRGSASGRRTLRGLNAREPGDPTVARRRRCCPARIAGVAGRRGGGPRGEGRWPQALDERSSGVRQPRSTCEAGEQRRGIGGGAGGGKAAGQGEHGPANRAPDAAPGPWRVKGAGSCAPSRKRGQGRAVHRAVAPRWRRATACGVSGVEPQRGGG